MSNYPNTTIGPSVCFKVQKIIGVSMGDGNLRSYQVLWEPSWISSLHLVGCEHLIEEYMQEQCSKSHGSGSTAEELPKQETFDDNRTNENSDILEKIGNDSLTVSEIPDEDSMDVKQCIIRDETISSSDVVVEGVKDTDMMEPLCPRDSIATDCNLTMKTTDTTLSNQDQVMKATVYPTIEIKEETEDEEEIVLVEPSDQPPTTAFSSPSTISCEYDNTSTISQHTLNAHCYPYTDSTQCQYCQEQFTSLVELEQHLIIVHAQSDDINPPIIHMTQSVKTLLPSRSQDNVTESIALHSGQTKTNGVLPNTCSVCGKFCISPSKLVRHMRVHTGERPYKCDFCTKAFKDKVHLKRHMQTHQMIFEPGMSI